MDRRTFLALAAGLAATTACQAPAPTPALREKATIGLTYIPNVQFSPFYLAVDNQEFARRGLDAELRHHGANESLFDALLAGREDLVLAGGDELVQARANGADIVAVAGYYRTYPIEIIARDDVRITSAADLRGKKVGVPGRYGESWFGLLLALRKAGLTQADVDIVEIGYTAQAAMSTKRVDAMIGFANNDAVQLKLAGIGITEIPLAEHVPLVSTSLITTSRLANERPAVVRNAVAGMLAGVRAAVGSPSAAVTATAARLPSQDSTAQQAARATMDASIGLLAAPDGTVDGRMDKQSWEDMTAFMLEQGLIPTPVAAFDAMTNRFVEP